MKPLELPLPKVLVLIVLFLAVITGIKIAFPQWLGLPPRNQSTEKADHTTPPAEQLLSNEVHSGDGTMTLIRKVELKSGQPQTYTFHVVHLTGADKKELPLFTRAAAAGPELSIPLNSWSPDNKYLYLQEKDTAGQFNYLVFKATGEPWADGEPYLDVRSYFTKKLPKSTLREATGWASPIFLNVVTNEGAAYWFDVTALAFWGHR
jgi:hypothetical protein